MDSIQLQYKTLFRLAILEALLLVALGLPIVPLPARIGILVVGGIFLVLLVLLVVRLASKDYRQASRWPLVLGALLVAGGIFFDAGATLYYSPDLSREANPVARLLLDMGISSKVVVVTGVIGQLSFAGFLVGIWVLFLKNYQSMVEQGRLDQGWFDSTVLLFSGPNATRADFFLGRGDPQWSLLSMGAALVVFSLYRWYLGLEWLGWVPISRFIVPTAIAILALGSVVAVFRRSVRILRRQE